jgi:hypothetical protein
MKEKNIGSSEVLYLLKLQSAVDWSLLHGLLKVSVQQRNKNIYYVDGLWSSLNFVGNAFVIKINII